MIHSPKLPEGEKEREKKGGRGEGGEEKLAGSIHSHKLLEGALRLLDRAPLAIAWLDFVLH